MFKDRFERLMMFEADGGSGGGGDADDGGSAGANDGSSSGDDGGSNEPPKTFTQEQVTSIAAREKKQGIAKFLSEHGIADTDAAVAIFAAHKDAEEKQKTDTQKAHDAKSAAEAAQKAAEAKAIHEGYKVKAILAGANADDEQMVEDIVILAERRINDDTDFEGALEALKKAQPALFEGSRGDNNKAKGTGGKSNPPRRSGTGSKDTDSLGARLAQKRADAAKNSKEHSYFTET